MRETPESLTTPPEGYSDWLTDLKGRIHSAQQRATLAVNRELVLLYWQIGQDILTRQARQGWGSKVIERLAQDLRKTGAQLQQKIGDMFDQGVFDFTFLRVKGQAEEVETVRILKRFASQVGLRLG